MKTNSQTLPLETPVTNIAIATAFGLCCIIVMALPFIGLPLMLCLLLGAILQYNLAKTPLALTTAYILGSAIVTAAGLLTLA